MLAVSLKSEYGVVILSICHYFLISKEAKNSMLFILAWYPKIGGWKLLLYSHLIVRQHVTVFQFTLPCSYQ